MKKLTKKEKENIIKNIPDSDHDGVMKEDLRDKLNLVIDGMHIGFERMDKNFEDIYQKFERIDRHFISIDQRFDKLESRMDIVDLELAQIKDVVLNIQQEKASVSDVLKIEKRVTKLEIDGSGVIIK
jgi:hypothetical protein